MSNLSSLTSAQFKRAAELKEQLEALTNELAALLDGGVVASVTVTEIVAEPAKKKGKFSAAGLARLRAAQKARWARVHAAQGTTEKPERKKRRKMSAAGRAKIAAGARARWAKFHAQKGL